MAQLFSDQHGGLLVQRLVDGGHNAHAHQSLDYISRFHCHALGKITNGNRFRNFNFSDHWFGWLLEAVPFLFGFLFRPQRLAQRGVLFIVGNDDRLIHRTATGTAMTCGLLLGFAVIHLVGALTSFLLLRFALFVLGGFRVRRRHRNIGLRDGRLRLHRLAGYHFRLFIGRWRGLRCAFAGRSFSNLWFSLFCRRLLCYRLLADFRLFPGHWNSGLFRLGLRLQLGALHISATLAHFYIDGFTATGTATGLESGGGFSFQGNLFRLCLSLTVVLAQIGQQLLFLITGHRIILRAGLEAGFYNLTQQTIHGSAYIFGQLFNGYFCHTGPPPD